MKWLQTITTTGPATEPVSLVDMKAHLHVTSNDDDARISPLIAAARAHVEKVTNTRLITQTVVMRADRFEPVIRLPVGPIETITTLNYFDTAGAEQAVANTVYFADLVGIEPMLSLKPGQFWPATLDTPAAVKITAQAGAATVDPAIALAVKLLVEGWYDDPKAVPPANIDDLLANHRRGI